MKPRYNYYKDARGITHRYIMCSDLDTPDKRERRSKQSEQSKCALMDCKVYKTCNHIQLPDSKVKCTNYKHPLR